MPYFVVVVRQDSLKAEVVQADTVEQVCTELQILSKGPRCLPMVFEGNRIPISGGNVRYLMMPDGVRVRITPPDPEPVEDESPIFGDSKISDDSLDAFLKNSQSAYYPNVAETKPDDDDDDDDADIDT